MAAGPLALRRPQRLSAGKTTLSWSSEGCRVRQALSSSSAPGRSVPGSFARSLPPPSTRLSRASAEATACGVPRGRGTASSEGSGQRPRPLGRRLQSQGRGDGFPGWKTSHSPSWLPPSQPAPGDHGLSAPLRDSKAAWQAAHADVRFLPSRLHARHQQSPVGSRVLGSKHPFRSSGGRLPPSLAVSVCLPGACCLRLTRTPALGAEGV